MTTQPRIRVLNRNYLLVCATSLFAIVACTTPSTSTAPAATYGLIHFLNDKNEEKCTLPIPQNHGTYDFSPNNQYCENNMVATFWLENVPSATLIQLYENEACSDARTAKNFFFKLKTVKQPTDWQGGSISSSIDILRNSAAGQLLPKKNVRVDDAFVGSEFSSKNLNERLSCVYIERSQPVN